jgi:hypothetical protein
VAGVTGRLKQMNRLYLAVGAIVVIVLLTSVVLAFWQFTKSNDTTSQAAVTDLCQQKNDITFGCYKNQLADIIDASGPEAATALLKDKYQASDFIRSQCHQLLHIVGREAYAKYGNLTETFTHGDPFCWSGYYHGVMEELSKEKGNEVIKTANTICADLKQKQFASFDHYNCVHGMGHGFMFILNQDMYKSLAACDSLTDNYESSSCYGGVFMQNIMNVQTPDREADYVSAYLNEEEPMYPCTAVAEKYKTQCYLMQTSYALQAVGYDYQKVFALCDETPQAYQTTCYQSLGRDASGGSISDVEQTKAKCLLGKDFNAQSNCIIGAAKDFVSYFHSDQQAKQLCSSLPQALSSVCSQTVTSYYSSF